MLRLLNSVLLYISVAADIELDRSISISNIPLNFAETCPAPIEVEGRPVWLLTPDENAHRGGEQRSLRANCENNEVYLKDSWVGKDVEGVLLFQDDQNRWIYQYEEGQNRQSRSVPETEDSISALTKDEESSLHLRLITRLYLRGKLGASCHEALAWYINAMAQLDSISREHQDSFIQTVEGISDLQAHYEKLLMRSSGGENNSAEGSAGGGENNSAEGSAGRATNYSATAAGELRGFMAEEAQQLHVICAGSAQAKVSDSLTTPTQQRIYNALKSLKLRISGDNIEQKL